MTTTTLTWAVFLGGLLVGLANTVGILASALDVSGYYPPGTRDWTYYTLWGLSHGLNAAIIAVAFLQWNTIQVPQPLDLAAMAAFVGGFTVGVVAGYDLGTTETQGLEGELRTDGWYRYSRNPQYVGYVVATVAFPVWSGAPLTGPLCGIYLVWWLTFPFAEEPWLRDQYGDAYERYADRVPRFVGRRTLQALVTDRGRA